MFILWKRSLACGFRAKITQKPNVILIFLCTAESKQMTTSFGEDLSGAFAPSGLHTPVECCCGHALAGVWRPDLFGRCGGAGWASAVCGWREMSQMEKI